MANTNLIPINLDVPAHVANRIGKGSAVSDSLSSGMGMSSDFPRISIKASRFRIVEDGTETVLDTTKLETVIVGANPNLSKLYYATAWNSDSEGGAPDCFSYNGISPHPESASPQNDLCATCPHNAWGSKVTPTGNKTKSCADQRRLAVVSADDADGPIYLLQVTPAALKGLKDYNNELKRRGIPVEIVKTVVSFDSKASFPKLTFGFGGFLDDETQATIDARLAEPIILDITGVGETEAPAKPVAAKAPAQVAQPEPQPVPETPAEEPAPEAPTRGFGKGTAAKAAPKQEAKAETKPVQEEPKAAAPASPESAALADEIAALIGGADDDA